MRKLIGLLIISALSYTTMSQSFEILPVPSPIQKEMVAKGTIAKEAPVQIERLRLVRVPFKDFAGTEKTGQMIVLDVVSKAVGEIFVELFEQKFPLEKVELITLYNGNDDASMRDNNSSAHNFRPVAGTSRLSLHSYGTAIDINPVQNPYILFNEGSNQATFLPPNSIGYANRMLERLGKPARKGLAEEVVEIFARHGFYWWGGYWDTPIDYQHFQLDRNVSYILAQMTEQEAQWFFELLKNYYNKFKTPLESLLQEKADKPLFEKYLEDRKGFKAWVTASY